MRIRVTNLKRVLLIIALVLMSILSGCMKGVAQGQDVTDFFIRTDGYISEFAGRPYELLLTYYCKNGSDPILSTGNIICVEPVGVEDLTVTIGQIQPMKEVQGDQYQGYGVSLYCTFCTPGIYELEYLDFQLGEDQMERFPIGKWQFDISEDTDQAGPLLYNDFVATSAPNVYRFGCSNLDENIRIEKIYYSKDQYITVNDGLTSTGKAELENISAPIYVVRPKIIAAAGEEKMVLHGTECACGALDVDDNDIAASREYTYENRKEK